MARATTVVIASNDCAGDPLRIKGDSSAGALDGLGKRGTSVGIVNHGRAGDEPEGLAQNLASSKFCDIGRRRRIARGWASRVSGEDAERIGAPATQRNVVRVQAGIVTGT